MLPQEEINNKPEIPKQLHGFSTDFFHTYEKFDVRYKAFALDDNVLQV